MIKKILIMTAAIFLAYSTVIYMLHPSSIGQNALQSNTVKIENFIFENPDYHYVVVGTSLSGLPMSLIKSTDYYDLSFSGSSLYDGLEIIKRSKAVPKIIFIETNYLFLLSYKILDANKSMFMRPVFYIKKNIPAFREKYQPMSVALHYSYVKLRYWLGKIQGGAKNKKADLVSAKKLKRNSRDASREAAVFRNMLAMKNKEYSTIPDQKPMDVCIEKLGEYCAFFQKRGVKIVFFEIPVDASISVSPLATCQREFLRKHFKPGDYDYIPMPDCSLYKTTDGVHLDYASSVIYKDYFLKEAQARL